MTMEVQPDHRNLPRLLLMPSAPPECPALARTSKLPNGTPSQPVYDKPTN
jgi:hypothetical protein